MKIKHANHYTIGPCPISLTTLKAVGIYDAIEMRSAKLPPLDPFLEIDGIVIPTNDFNSTLQFPEKDHPDVNSRHGGDDSEQSTSLS